VDPARRHLLSKRGKVAEIQPTLDFGPQEPAGVRLTNEVRAELVALTGHDIAADDPIMALVVLNQILLSKIAHEVAAILVKANEDAGEALAMMRTETLKSVAADLLLLAGQSREALKIDLTEAAARASSIVGGIESSLRMRRAFWVAIGAVGCALFGLGLIVGAAVGR
jgi:hypothetical protein